MSSTIGNYSSSPSSLAVSYTSGNFSNDVFGGENSTSSGGFQITTAPSNGDNQSADIGIQETATKVMYLIIGVLGVVGNIFVALIFVGGKLIRKSYTNIFILNQSVIDFITATFLILTTLIKHNGRYLNGLADDMFCRFWLGKIPIWSCIFSSTYSLVFLTIERYLEVNHPIWHKVNFNSKLIAASLIIIWLIGPVFNVASSVPPSRIVQGECVLLSFWPSDAAQTAAGFIAVILQYFIPIAILIFCYGSMIVSLHKRGNQIFGKQSSKKENKMSKAKGNVVKTLVMVSLAFILCYSWNQWFFLFFNIKVLNYTHFQGDFYHFSVVAMFANCSVNPFIYALTYGEFRKAIKVMFRCGRNNSIGPNSTVPVSTVSQF